MNRQKIAILLVSFVIIAGWLISQNKFHPLNTVNNSNTSIPANAMTSSAEKIDRGLLNANTKFAFKLFSQTLQEDNEQNVFISPTSVAIALTLLYNGAAGETQQQMAEVLGLQGLQLAEINDAYQQLQEILENQSEVELSIANSLWLKKGFPLESKFLENNQKYYQAEVTELDFNNPNAKTTINNWVSKETKGKIEKIIDSISPENVLFLINAIYFKGTWTTEFEPKLTKEQPFFLDNGETINHPLMSQQGEKMYYENDEFQAVSLPYGKDKRLSMYIFLPKENSNINSFLENLSSESWQVWQENFKQQEGFLSLPKFKLEYEISLNKTLQAIGMTEIFSKKANFKNMTPEKVAVDEVKHKTFVEVNEEGTEAAAVTSIGIRVTSMPINQPFRMIVNRPFFYAIQDNKTGTILFMGQMLDPR
jgi:serpin B